MSVETSSWALPRAWAETGRRESHFLYGIATWLALIQISIAASQIVLAVLVGIWLVRVRRGELVLPSLPVDRPFALYAGLSVIAAVFSFDPALGLSASKKLLLLVVPYVLVSSIRRRGNVETLVLVLIVVADIGALVGLWQYRFGALSDLDHRIHGFVGHYMTYSGLLMGVGVLAVGQLLFQKRHRAFLVASLSVMGPALLLTLTRSAWLGMVLSALLLLFLRDRRLLLLIPAMALGAALLLPRGVEHRIDSFIKPDRSGWDRLYMLEAGAHMIANHPFFGVGPDMVAEVYPIYASRDAPSRNNPHLHNNLAQIAAERGLPCLVAWLWFIAVAFTASIRSYRSASEPTTKALAAGAMGLFLAAFLAGLFEYNFGDSELQMLFLFAMSIPWILERERAQEKATSAT